MTKRKLTLATRKWKRQFNQAVAASIAKTITEPVTNSYDSYKRAYGSIDATTGFVGRILDLNVGTQLLHADLASDLPKRPDREIRIRISKTSKSSGLEKRECQVIDRAEGMSEQLMNEKFEKYGADKSGAGAGQAVRGLFGQGICDVVYSHKPGQIRSIQADEASTCDFTWEGTPGMEEPAFEVLGLGKAIRKVRGQWGIPTGNGTCVSFVLDEECRVPSYEDLLARLSVFYMLRLINSDPHCRVTLEQARADGVREQRLTYNFPRGQVIGKFHAEIRFRKYKPIGADVVVVRAETPLPTKDALDLRANGLLIVDEFDTVYDQTLFGQDGNAYLDQIFGVVRLSGVRDVIRDCLNRGEAHLTESRDGFDTRLDLYKAIEAALKPGLDPILKREIDRRLQPTKVLSEVGEKKVRRALQKLNELFEDVTKEHYDGAKGGLGATVPEFMSFEEERVQLRIGQPRRMRLLANASRFRPGSAVIADCDSVDVRIEPSSTVLGPSSSDRLLVVNFTLTAATLGAKAAIVALAQDVDGKDAEAELQVVDVTLPETILPPESGLEFQPRAPRSAPNRVGAVSLLINPLIVPLGTPIVVQRGQGDTGISLVGESGDDQAKIVVEFTKNHLLPGGSTGRIGLSFRGYGYGQKAKITADCFPKPKHNVRAEVWIAIEETKSSSGGVFRELQYKPLPGRFARNAGEFIKEEGIITVNSLHPVNRAALGPDEASFRKATDGDRTAQFRLAQVIVDTCLYHTMTVAYGKSEVPWDADDPVSSVRYGMELYKDRDHVEEEVYRQVVDGFRVPKVPGAE